MSPVMPSNGESLQEMIDRYNRELLRMGSLEHSHGQNPGQPSPQSPVRPPLPRPRPEPSEPLYNIGSGMPRPIPSEPLDEHHSPAPPPHAGACPSDPETQQGLAELRQGLRDLMNGLAELQAGLRELQQGLGGHMHKGHSGRAAHSEPSLPAAAALSGSAAEIGDRVPVTPTIPGRVTAQGASPIPEDNYGTLIVQVFTARRAEPVPGAQVAVTMPGDEGELLYKIMTTDEDGRTPSLRLPVAGYATGAPDYRSPFVNYRVYASADGFQPSGALTAQMFPGVTSILPVELIPGEKVSD